MEHGYWVIFQQGLRSVASFLKLRVSLHDRPIMIISWTQHSDTLLITYRFTEFIGNSYKLKMSEKPGKRLFASWGQLGLSLRLISVYLETFNSRHLGVRLVNSHHLFWIWMVLKPESHLSTAQSSCLFFRAFFLFLLVLFITLI